MSDTIPIATVRKNQREEIWVGLRQYQGHALFDVRVCSEPYSGDQFAATKKGVCASVKLLPALIAALQEAETEARRRGLNRLVDGVFGGLGIALVLLWPDVSPAVPMPKFANGVSSGHAERPGTGPMRGEFSRSICQIGVDHGPDL